MPDCPGDLRRLVHALLLAVLVIVLPGCSTPKPVLYPNDQYQRGGEAAAQSAAGECMRRADEFVKSGGATATQAGQVAKGTAVGGATGAAVGAVGGAVVGDAGRGAAVGAATGATAGLLGSLFSGWGEQKVDPVYASFVERCLRERGYEPIGWK